MLLETTDMIDAAFVAVLGRNASPAELDHAQRNYGDVESLAVYMHNQFMNPDDDAETPTEIERIIEAAIEARGFKR